jgi:hypothetical protein
MLTIAQENSVSKRGKTVFPRPGDLLMDLFFSDLTFPLVAHYPVALKIGRGKLFLSRSFPFCLILSVFLPPLYLYF